MTLDEAIKHAEEVAERKERDLKVYKGINEDRPLFKEEENECQKCAEEHRQLAEWLKELKSLREQKCEDAISRQAVLDLVNADWKYEGLEEPINNLPPVTPQPKIGHWIDDGQYAEGHSEHACRCSKCGYTYIGYTDKYKDCPNCGAKMVEPQEGSEKV